MIGKKYKGGKIRQRARHFVIQCLLCGDTIPESRWNEVTCDDTCKRARNSGRSRQEQFWRDYADNKITV